MSSPGSCASARAIATRCHWPRERSAVPKRAPELGVEAVFQRRRDRVEPRLAHHPFDRRAVVEQHAPVAERDVLAQTRLVDHRALGDQAQAPVPGREVESRERNAVDADRSRAGIVEARQQLRERGLPRPVVADQRHHRSGVDLEREIFERWAIGARVGEAEAVELEARRANRSRLRTRRRGRRRRWLNTRNRGPALEEVGEVGEEERPLARSADLGGEVARRGAQPHARQCEGGEAGEVDRAGARARGHPGHRGGEADQVDGVADDAPGGLSRVERGEIVVDAGQALAEAGAEERRQAQDLRFRDQLTARDVAQVVGGPALTARARTVEREALATHTPVMDDERRGHQHQRRRGEPVHPGQHADQREAEHGRPGRAGGGDEEAQERSAGIVGGARQHVLRVGVLEEGEVERRRVIEDPARELEVQDVAQPQLGIAPQRRGGALEQHQEQAQREPGRRRANVDRVAGDAHLAVDRGNDEADRQSDGRRQQRGEQRRGSEQLDQPRPGLPGEGERPAQGGP